MLHSYFWELAFYDIKTGDRDYINSNADELKAAMNHRVE